MRFIYVYRLAIDARPKRGDGVAVRKYPSLLEDFQTAAASMVRKRHLHLPQGVYLVFVLFHLSHPFKSVQSVKSVVKLRRNIPRTGTPHQSKDIVVAPGEPILYCHRQLFCFVAFRLPTADLPGGEVQSGKLACMDEHHHQAARA